MKKSFAGGKSGFAKPRPARSDRPAYAGGAAGGAARTTRSARGDDAPPYSDPYRSARRPKAAESDDAAPSRAPRAARGSFTVTLDDDVAKVFRGDASVNKALRLVMQLTQVVAGPPRTGAGQGGFGQRRFERGNAGNAGAGYGAARTPRTARFDEDDEE